MTRRQKEAMNQIRVVGLVAVAGLAVVSAACSGGAPDSSPATEVVTPGPDAGGLGEDGGPEAGPVSACEPGRLAPGKVSTTGGVVEGAKSGSAWSWKGIPFAAPPVGALRWQPPAPFACAPGVRDATKAGPACAQVDKDGKVIGSEDCLTLNVWAPEDAKDAPVLFFVHGGANTKGTASDPIYDGAALAAKTGAVVVTAEYRLGVMGFFAHPKLDEESADKVSGNYGILDQIAALQWVRENIASFGGAPSKVLLFGESAGAQDVLVHVASPLSKGLFTAVAVESGGVYRTKLADGEVSMKPIVQLAGCDSVTDVLACLRGKSPASLVQLPSAEGPLDNSGLRYTPLVDGHVLQGTALEVIEAGKHNRVPMVIGTNRNETSRMVPKVTTTTEYEAAVRAQYGTAAGETLLGLYPASAFPSPRAALVQLTTDATWTCPIRRLTRAAAQGQSEPVFRYQFSWSAPGPAGAVVGATHGLELPFVFGTFSALSSSFTPGAGELALSSAMQGSWVALAATGSPNLPGGPTWPRYVAATDPFLELNAPIVAGAGLATSQCDAMDAFAQ